MELDYLYKHPDMSLKHARLAHKAISAACNVSKLSLWELLGKSRKADRAIPRMVVAHALRKHGGLTLTKTAYCIGRQDHNTIIHACKRVEFLLETNNYQAVPVHNAVMAAMEVEGEELPEPIKKPVKRVRRPEKPKYKNYTDKILTPAARELLGYAG